MIDRILESVTANLEKAAKNVDDKPGGSFTGDLVKTYVKARVEKRAYELPTPKERAARAKERAIQSDDTLNRRKGEDARAPRKRVYGPIERAVRKATGTLGKRKTTFTGKQVKKAVEKASPEAKAKMKKDYDSTTPQHKRFNKKK
jgi:hypothetical protein